MEHFYAEIKDVLSILCKSEPSLRQSLQNFISKQIWSPADRSKLLTLLANLLISSSKETCLKISMLFGPLTVELLYRCCLEKLEDLNEALDRHEQLCIVIGWLSQMNLPSISYFSISYLEQNGSPFARIMANNESSTKRKKRKKMKSDQFSQVIEATYYIVTAYPSILKLDWHWSELVGCLKNATIHITSRGKWFLMKLLGVVVGLNSIEVVEIDEKEGKLLQLDLFLGVNMEINSPIKITTSDSKLTYTKHAIVSSDLSSHIVPVCGVLLNKTNEKEAISESSLLITETLKDHLQQIAIAISEAKPVLIEGPVGCGKTAVIEYLAQITGHTKAPHLTKVQLSDDTDSKTLTGSYVCTAVPGEFIWQPGLLVQACKEGNWIVFEDIDKAPMDVISLLLPLMESGHLNVPGRFDETNSVSHKLQIFLTRRASVMTSALNNISMLTKHCISVKLDAIQQSDLKKIILLKYPMLENIVDRLLTIYAKLDDEKVVRASQRKSSTRDLLKWCSRVARFSTNPQELATNIAMTAMDCFVASQSHSDSRLNLANMICAELSLSQEMAEYFCETYKPELDIQPTIFKVGRYSLPHSQSFLTTVCGREQPFAQTRHSLVLLERVTGCVDTNEPVLLVGETGVGKTSALQYLAQKSGHALHVINMSQQSSSNDLLGGYKPAQMKHFVAPVREKFEQLFISTFSKQRNSKFLSHVQNCFANKRYNDLNQLMMHSCKAAVKKMNADQEELLSEWREMALDLDDLRTKLKSDSAIAFDFVEGKLSKCLQRGDWLLLDEINLAAPECLECLSGVLESTSGSIVLMERGDAKPITRHHQFRIFAAMNPATDVGKRNLSEGIRNRFTEIFVDEPTDYNDISTIVAYYLSKTSIVGSGIVEGIVNFYKEIRKLSLYKLVDGTGRKPHYSLRTLCRALQYVSDNSNVSLLKSLFEGFCLSFLTALDRSSHPLVVDAIVRHIVGRSKLKSVLKLKFPVPSLPSINVEGHHILCGALPPTCDENYIITPSVQENLKELSRPVAYGKYPILIQGETSTGKTSLINYLGKLTGNKVVRINNHEHTDLQEYVGSYASDGDGRLTFQDGPLVTAMREGHWIILDELNLAPTDILEALNRVLDDNRELFINETQEVVHAHPRFTLFATQNPPGSYGGRKLLSRAFRNRFIELHFDEIPNGELETILNKRCHLAPAHCKKLIKIMLTLQERRRISGLFAGKQGFITLRDMFRWAERHRKFKTSTSDYYDWEQHLANDGFLLLAGRVRKAEEEKVIEEVISKHLKKTIDKDVLFGNNAINELLKNQQISDEFNHIVWTQPMRRLYITLECALRFNEPVLLIGETGGGKTITCQLISHLLGRKLNIINCHANTEAADFIGGLRPARHNNSEDKVTKLFEWYDGPLVESMSGGQHLLVDEISLADDSVLERLNSVLEPERTLVIPDKVTEGLNKESVIRSEEGFQFLATMNPGGDFGKKELSFALRNRMTEIWCSVVEDSSDLNSIVLHNLRLNMPEEKLESCQIYSGLIVDFVTWFKSTVFGKRFVISVRDLLTWANFMCSVSQTLDLPSSYAHAACLVYIDGLGSGISGGFVSRSKEAHQACLEFILKQLQETNQIDLMSTENRKWLGDEAQSKNIELASIVNSPNRFGIGPFIIDKGPDQLTDSDEFTFQAHSTSVNALRLLRALQLPRPILLEGSPGGGKTSLVSALAKRAGFQLVRINLSEQTDASDLFGADLPVEEGTGGQFCWRDGPLLSALKAGHWIVLDELNLTSQSVLESLNSVFDHRGELFLPELGRSFQVDRTRTKIFACQNPVHEGGGRKGLPKSFLNRFTQVHVDNLSSQDLGFILHSTFPLIEEETLNKMVEFNDAIVTGVVKNRTLGHKGSPWEFNLRDMTRWCQLVMEDIENKRPPDCSKHVHLVYMERMRTHEDREKMIAIYYEIFGRDNDIYQPSKLFHMTSDYLQIGSALIARENHNKAVPHYNLLPSMLQQAEGFITAITMSWPCILTGGSGSGKTRLVKAVASLCGKKLQILATNSSMDAIELLGGYEQADFEKSLLNLNEKAKSFLMDACQNLLKKTTENSCSSTNREKTLSEFQRFLKLAEDIQECTNNSEKMENLYLKIEQETSKCDDLEDTMVSPDFLAKYQRLSAKKQNHGTYQWNDSLSVKALVNGDWLMVDSANFCSASVLDRLNALLEPHGVLSITERGIVDGRIVEIKPHPDFRLILSLDPQHGELSRAMRNRCLEINFTSLQSSEELKLVVDSKCRGWSERNDCRELLESFDCDDSQKDGLTNLDLIDQTLQKSRRKLFDINEACQMDSSRNKKESFYIPSPYINDFITQPTLSNIWRQFKIFEAFSALTNGASEMDKILALYRIFMQYSTNNDWKSRIVILEKFMPKFLSIHCDEKLKQHLMQFLVDNSIQKLVFESLFHDDEKNMNFLKDLPWDCRWNLQILKSKGFENDCVRISKLVELSLYTFVQLCLKKLEHFTNPGRLTRKKKLLVKVSSFHLSVGYDDKTLLLSDLPHPVLTKLFAFYKQWHTVMTSTLHKVEYSSDSIAKLIELESYFLKTCCIWRWMMFNIFHISSFMSRYLKLKKNVLLFTETFQKSSDLVQFQHSFSSMDKLLEIESDFVAKNKAQNQLRKFYLNRNGEIFSSEKEFFLQQLTESSIRDIEVFSNKIFSLGHISNCTWNEFTELLNMLQNLSHFYCKRQCFDNDGMTNDSVMEKVEAFCEKLKTMDIPLSAKTVNCFKKLEIDVATFQIDVSSKELVNFGLRKYEIQLWPIINYFDLNFYINQAVDICDKKSFDYIGDFNIASYRYNYVSFKQPTQTDDSTVDLERHLLYLQKQVLNKVWISVSLNNRLQWIKTTDNEVDGNCGPGDLLRPVVSDSVFHLLYSDVQTTRGPIRSMSDIENQVFDNVVISLKDFDEHASQLKHLKNILWKGAESFAWSPVFPCNGVLENLFLMTTNALQSLITIAAKYSCGFAVSDVLLKSQAKLKREIEKFTGTFVGNTILGIRLNALSTTFESFCFLILSQTDQVETKFSKTFISLLYLCSCSVINIVKSSMEYQAVHTNNNEQPQLVDKIWLEVGKTFLFVGLIQMLVTSPFSLVDPNENQKIKLECLENELVQLECELEVQSLSHQNLTGNAISSAQDITEYSHPRILALFNRINMLKAKVENLRSKVAFRPEQTKFPDLVKECGNFSETVINKELLLRLINDLTTQNSHNLAILSEEKLQITLDSFSKHISEKYLGFPDFVQPITEAVSQIRFGLRIVKTTSQILFAYNQMKANYRSVSPEIFMSDLVDGKIDFENSESVVKSVDRFLQSKGCSDENRLDNLMESILMTNLIRVQENCQQGSTININQFVKTLEKVVGIWNNKQEILAKKEEEKACLFKYKSTKHELNEESEIEEEFNEMFPNFDEDLDDTNTQTEESDSDGNTQNGGSAENRISEKLFQFTIFVHSSVVLKLTENERDCKDKTNNFNYENQTTLFAHHALSSLCKDLFPWLHGNHLEVDFLPSHITTVHKLSKFLNRSDSHPAIDIYNDSNPGMISKCLPVLNNLLSAITDTLLVEWPDHPVLKNLVIITERILSFSVNNPVMKFVAGLELLLAKAQEWESNASKQVSLFTHLESITSLVLDWRKLELKSWNKLLDNTLVKSSTDDTKWWFYIYQLVEDGLKKNFDDDYQTTVTNIVLSLQQFLESANIAQFVSRISMLNVFYCHICFKGHGKDLVAMAIYNLHKYYSQFIDECVLRIKSLRKPIEKELKDFIKIAKWNDINFYAVKDSVTRTHRTLFKLIRKFSSCLTEPVVLNVLKGSTAGFINSKQNENTTGQQLLERWKNVCSLNKPTISIEHLKEYYANCDADIFANFDKLAKLPTILVKLNKHTGRWVTHMHEYYPALLLDLEECTSDVVENFQQLRSLEPKTPLSEIKEEREKRLSEAKHILSRKKKSLSELFKLLRQIGLSYRKGLIWGKNTTSSEILMSASPLSGSVSNEDKLLTESLFGGQSYFYKLLSRWSVLNLALHSPNKAIGLSDINRIQGLVGHLLQISVEQRCSLFEMIDARNILTKMHCSLTNILQYMPDEHNSLFNEENISQIISCKKNYDIWLQGLRKLDMILQCCPNNNEHTSKPSFKDKHGSLLSTCCHGDSNWTAVNKLVVSEIESIQRDLVCVENIVKNCLVVDKNLESYSLKPGCLITHQYLLSCQNLNNKLDKSMEIITKTLTASFDGSTTQYDNVSNNSLVEMHSPLIRDVLRARKQILENQFVPTKSEPQEVWFNAPLNSVVTDMMIAVQNLVKRQREIQENGSIENVNLLDGHLALHTHGNLEHNYKALQVNNVMKKFLNLIGNIKKTLGHVNQEKNEEYKSVIHSLLALVNEYTTILHSSLLASSLAHRSTCKLAYILSTIFTEVVTKGFCPPAEFEEELAGDKGEFKEVEDAGMGEGQGSKDVSDQIEDEQQVEDQPGAEPQDQDEEEIAEEDDGIEMTEDFEGKLHDGELEEEEEGGSSGEEDEKEELDKQMGDLGDEHEADKLDERMWGSEDEEEEESESKEEERGAGVDKEKSEIGAKDDDIPDDNQEEESKQREEKEEEDVKDEGEFDPNERDDNYAKEPNEVPEPMDLDDDLQLDKDEKGNENEENDETAEPDIMELDKQDDIPIPKDAEIEDENAEEKEDENKEGEEDESQHPEKEEDLPEQQAEEQVEEGEEEEVEMKGEEAGIEQQNENEDKVENDENNNEEKKENENGDNRNSETQLQTEEEENEDSEKNPTENTSRKEIENTEDEIVQSEKANEQVEQQTKEEGKDEQASGTAPSSDQSGVDSSNTMSTNLMDQNKGRDNENKHEKKLGQSDSKRSLANPEQTVPKRLKTMETEVKDVENSEDKKMDRDADYYQHLDDEEASYDKETLDAATEDQQEKQKNKKEETTADSDEEQNNGAEDQLTKMQEDVVMATQDEKQPDSEKESSKLQMKERNNLQENSSPPDEDLEEEKPVAMETDLVKDLPASSIHTEVSDWNPDFNLMALTPDEIIKIRQEMEKQLQEISQSTNPIELAEHEKLWHEYQSLVQPLSQELCEQLRLILEPTQRSKLKGDYRSGKRLNMRKVIPYIASGFRKDKIWLRRSKPSKREYQIMVAIDDSSSMADNHTKQLAFESLCVISTALSTLEAGQLGVCNFGESAQLLHDFYQPFTDHSGALILQKCTFKQDQTKVAKLLETSVGFMKTSQSTSSSSADPRISQLLLIISDGRGLYVEGKEKVESAVRAAKEAGIFLAFVILDNPACKDSILDIKVPIFEEGKMPQIRSYLADFPFPFYVIIRDTNALPETLSDALRSWFEIVTSME